MNTSLVLLLFFLVMFLFAAGYLITTLLTNLDYRRSKIFRYDDVKTLKAYGYTVTIKCTEVLTTFVEVIIAVTKPDGNTQHFRSKVRVTKEQRSAVYQLVEGELGLRINHPENYASRLTLVILNPK